MSEHITSTAHTQHIHSLVTHFSHSLNEFDSKKRNKFSMVEILKNQNYEWKLSKIIVTIKLFVRKYCVLEKKIVSKTILI